MKNSRSVKSGLLRWMLVLAVVWLGAVNQGFAQEPNENPPAAEEVDPGAADAAAEEDTTAGADATATAGSGGDAANGGKLFDAKCKSCHTVLKNSTGPALAGVEDRVPGGRAAIYAWIHNSPKVLASGDPYFTKLYADWNNTAMTAFPELTTQDIDDILEYINVESTKGGEAAGTAVQDISENPGIVSMSNWIKFLLLIVVSLLGLIALQVARLRGVELLAGVDLNKFNAILFPIFFIGLVVAGFWGFFHYYDHYLPESASEHGDDIDLLFNITSIFVIIVFILTNAILFYFAYKYRYDANRKAFFFPENHKLELIWTIVPAIVLAGLITGGIIVWNSTLSADPPADAYHVEVNGQQFEWNIRYPGPKQESTFGEIDLNRIDPENKLGIVFDKTGTDDFISPDLVLPKGKGVVLHIRSRDVLHSVYLPHFRVKMDAVPGMPTRFYFVPKFTTEEMRKMTGNPEFDYELACTEVCGKGHYSMRRLVKVVEQEEYANWLKEQTPEYNPEVHAFVGDNKSNDNLSDATSATE